jgi:hypothetical protein
VGLLLHHYTQLDWSLGSVVAPACFFSEASVGHGYMRESSCNSGLSSEQGEREGGSKAKNTHTHALLTVNRQNKYQSHTTACMDGRPPGKKKTHGDGGHI